MPIVIPIERVFDPHRLREKSAFYWLRCVAVTLAGMLAVTALDGVQWWRTFTADAYQMFRAAKPRRLLTPNETAVVLIEDHDYRGPMFRAKVPLDRAALAQVIERVAANHPRVIALDIDLSTPVWYGTEAEVQAAREAYRREMQPLRDAIRRAATITPVVLSRTIHYDEAKHCFIADPDEFDDLRAEPGRIIPAYTRIPRDPRQIPMQLEVEANGQRQLLDSFALAIARARNHRLKFGEAGEPLPFGDFIPESEFGDVRVDATRLVRDSAEATRVLAGNIVIIGGAWNAFGKRIDTHLTPAGEMPGALVHANYAEALIGQYTMRQSESVARTCEVLAAALMAMIFVAAIGRWKAILLALLGLTILPLSLVSLQNFGVYLDGAALLVLLGAHAVVEQVLEWREESRHGRPKPRWVIRAAWNALIVLTVVAFGGLMWIRHRAESAQEESMRELASMMNATIGAAGHAGERIAAARLEATPQPARKPVPVKPTLIARVQERFADEIANHLPEDARVRGGSCVAPHLANMQTQISGSSIVTRVPSTVSDDDVHAMLAASLQLKSEGARFIVVNGGARSEWLLARLNDVGISADAAALKLKHAAASELFLVAQCESLQ